MAAGDIVSVTVGTEGWYADIAISGLSVAGTYAFGLGTNNDPSTGNPKITFTVVSLGFDDTGTATTNTRIVYGTSSVRFPFSTASIAGVFTSGTFQDGETVTQSLSGATAVIVDGQNSGAKLYVKIVTGTPNATSVWTGGTSGAIFTSTATPVTLTLPTPNERFDGTNTIVRISLSEYIFSKDNTGGGNSGTAPTVSILSGFYTSSGTPNNASTSTFAVTNSSTQGHARCIANWAMVPLSRVGTSFTLRVVGGQRFGQSARPFRCVKYTVTDQHSNTVTVIQTAFTYDPTQGDAVPVVENVGTISTSTLTQGDTLTCNFIAYPWVGDAGSTMDTSDGVNTQPTPFYAPVKFVCDKAATYGASLAVVSTAGNDATGVAIAESAFNPGSPPAAFLTVNKAASAIQALNTATYSRTDAAGTIYMQAGNYPWTGASNTISGTTATWLTVTPFPGVAKSAVVFTTVSGSENLGATTMVHLKGLTVNVATAPVSIFDSFVYLWFDNVSLTANGTAPIFRVTSWYHTQGQVPSSIAGNGLDPFTTGAHPVLIRGVDLTGAGLAQPFTFIGNKSTSGSFSLRNNVSGTDLSTTPIIAFNYLTDLTNSSNSPIQLDSTTIGAALIQNLLELCTTVSNPVIRYSADASTDTPTDNVLIWHNTMAGGRINRAYNETGATIRQRRLWSEKNNLFEQQAIKSDTFPTQSGVRTGNWSLDWGVGTSGILNVEVTGFAASGSFQNEFPGIKSYSPASLGGSPPTSNTNPTTFAAFVNRACYDGTNPGTGNGNYRLQATSPALGMPRDFLLPFDISGSARTPGDASGAYTNSSSAPVLSGFFFTR